MAQFVDYNKPLSSSFSSITVKIFSPTHSVFHSHARSYPFQPIHEKWFFSDPFSLFASMPTPRQFMSESIVSLSGQQNDRCHRINNSSIHSGNRLLPRSLPHHGQQNSSAIAIIEPDQHINYNYAIIIIDFH